VAVSAALVVVLYLTGIIGKPKKSHGEGALHEREYRKFTLINKKEISPNTTIFRFSLPTATSRLGLPVGNHILLRFTDEDGKTVSRPYTPVSSDDDLGFFDVIIKIYPAGKMGQHLKKLPTGNSIEVRGPQGDLRYHGFGKFEILRKNAETGKRETQKTTVRRIGLIAGGSGITPMLQIARDVAKNNGDRTEVALIFANVTADDILLKDELDKLAAEHKNIRIFYTLDKPAPGWTGESGFVNAEMIKKCFGTNPDLALVCGPPRMLDFVNTQLKALDYRADQVFSY